MVKLTLLRPCKAGWVAGIQNGLVKDDITVNAVGAEAALGAACAIGAEQEADRSIMVSQLGITYVGEFDGAITKWVERVAWQLHDAGLSAQAVDDIRRVKWSKVARAAAAFGVQLLSRASISEIRKNVNLTFAYLALVREIEGITRSEGYGLRDYADIPAAYEATNREQAVIARRLATASPHGRPPPVQVERSSMLQDLVNGRPMEIEEIFGDLVERGRRHDLPVQGLELVLKVARGINPAASDSARDGGLHERIAGPVDVSG